MSLIAASSVLVGACSTDAGEGTNPAATERLANHSGARADVDLLQSTVSFDFDPFEAPSDMLAAVDIAVVGEIVSVETTSIHDDLEPMGAVIVGVKPSEEMKREVGTQGNVVHYWIHRPSNLGADVYRDALPVGTEVGLFGLLVDSSSDIRCLSPVPEVMYAPVPQGLYLPDRGATGEVFVNVWGDAGSSAWAEIETLDDLVAAARNGSLR